MKQIIESIKRLYQSGQISQDVIESLFTKGSINLEEKEYIQNK